MTCDQSGCPAGRVLVIAIGLLAGQMTYKWKMDIILIQCGYRGTAFVGIWLGTLPGIQGLFTAINGGAKSPTIFGTVTQAQFIWSLGRAGHLLLWAVLPIWRWAQPINYVAFWIVFLGILAGTIGLLIWHPGFRRISRLSPTGTATCARQPTASALTSRRWRRLVVAYPVRYHCLRRSLRLAQPRVVLGTLANLRKKATRCTWAAARCSWKCSWRCFHC